MVHVTDVRIAHTADLDGDALTAARALLDDVFEGDMTDHDFEHALGGVHALVWEGTELIGHASVIQRRLVHGGRALPPGYVGGVGGAPDRPRGGAGRAQMGPPGRGGRGALQTCAR